jgi:peptide/nickel transport system permease protein
MYMPFILLGVILITFALFQMSTTPEALARIQLGEKASARQIYDWLESKGQVSWTDGGNRKLDLLSEGKLDNKATPFYVRGKLDDFADRRDDLLEDIVDQRKKLVRIQISEGAAYIAGGGDGPLRPSKYLQEQQQKLGRMLRKRLANNIDRKDALQGARRIEASLIMPPNEVAEVLELDSNAIDLEFERELFKAVEDTDSPTPITGAQLPGVSANVAKRITEHEQKCEQSAAWQKYKPIRERIARVEDIDADLTYTAWYMNFAYYLWDVCRFEFGDTRKQRPVIDVIKEGMWPSLSLAIPGFFIAEIIGVFFGLLAAMYRQTRIDHSIVISGILLMSINAIALIMFGQKIFAADLNYFPITGYSDGFNAVRFLALPIILYIVITFGERVRFNRIVMLDETNQDYVRTGRAKGLSENTVLFKHIFRNSLIPLITRWVVAIPTLYLGSLVLESFFGIPGLGFLTVDAIANSDANVIRAIVVIGSVSFMLAALLSDVLYAVVDPRVKLN